MAEKYLKYGTFAEAAKGHRLSLQVSLRKFCLANGWEPGNISKLERGLLLPPRGEKLRTYASALGLVEGTDAWRDFCDLAAASRAEFPDDLQDEELLLQLPALFRTMRGDPPSDDQITRLIELLKKREPQRTMKCKRCNNDVPERLLHDGRCPSCLQKDNKWLRKAISTLQAERDAAREAAGER